MSEKQQRTATSMREKMLNRYGDELHHKHNKNHTSYRKHCKTHPVQTLNGYDEERDANTSTGLLRALRVRKIRKRLDKGRFH
ncbi:hypothetical protein [Legionella micdadei]|uniref:Transposase n=1 Tax=Legionella micdadei TaxID=451 RepID=A0A098GK63_LEGMI|nr:hypothetical protein [Legionella micdadei]ARG98773.1 hypothetical protein B6N58_14545 [Legionella micdadei]ARH01491.1 hypothetical protein B6V88_14410 [Legionella micdadei]KTD28998.1 hypothetical protein Lmic_0918 [Legionella micdadei]NSL17209.1 hypothetical protein [Legionella micdadei]CEG62382.1 conserved protein of unknown function [Legionella micdadei]